MLKGSPSALMASARTATARRSTSRMEAPEASRSRVESRNIQQQQDREIAVLRSGRAKHPWIGLQALAQRDPGVDHGIEV